MIQPYVQQIRRVVQLYQDTQWMEIRLPNFVKAFYLIHALNESCLTSYLGLTSSYFGGAISILNLYQPDSTTMKKKVIHGYVA